MPAIIRTIIFTALLAAQALLFPTALGAQNTAKPQDPTRIVGPEVSIQGRDIVVSAALRLGADQRREVESGISKEITLFIDLFRVWDVWPDEFVLGRRLVQTLRCDPVKKEYIATSLEGSTIKEKRFRDCGELMEWALNVEGVRLANTSELEPSVYFVKVTAESHVKRLPPIIRSLFFFIREAEFKVTKESPPFGIKK
ncbi:MAG: hypothetical protein Kow0025_26100 [Thermodesulfovibrionales bacterium]